MKPCTKCGTTKPAAEFAVDRAKSDGLDSWCRTCRNAARRDRYNANLDHEQQRSRDYYDANRDTIRTSRTSEINHQRYVAWKARYPGGLRIQWLKAAHGIAPEQWAAMLAEQGGQCYLCEQPLPDDPRKIAVDHDHTCCPAKRSCSTCRRGLAHTYCNGVIGFAGDDPAVLRRIADNLEQAKQITAALRLTAPEQGELISLDALRDQVS